MKTVKKSIVPIILIIFAVFNAFPVFAANTAYTVKDISFSLDDDYTVHTESDLLASSEVKGLIFAAISSDLRHQIQSRSTVTDFSSQLGSFSGLDSETIAPAAELLFPNGCETVNIHSTVYLKSVERTDNTYTVIYVTVSGGKLYTFTYFGDDPSRIGEFMSTVSLPSSDSKSNMKTYMIMLISVFIVAVAVLLVFIILSFVRDYRHHKMEQNENIVSQYIKIKRRKY